MRAQLNVKKAQRENRLKFLSTAGSPVTINQSNQSIKPINQSHRHVLELPDRHWTNHLKLSLCKGEASAVTRLPPGCASTVLTPGGVGV